jgi:hypothetical protein
VIACLLHLALAVSKRHNYHVSNSQTLWLIIMDFGEDRSLRSHGQVKPVDVMPAIAYASDAYANVFIPSLACLVFSSKTQSSRKLPGATSSGRMAVQKRN